MLSRILIAFTATLMLATPAYATRIKDLGAFQSVRPNQLVGYGIVVGLAGTGDDNLEYATQGMSGVASRFGLTLPPGVNPALKNAAAVMITAELPAFARPGQRLDITVSAMGRARSLRGGTLIMSPLRGADNRVLSTRIADARIDYVGRGEIARSSRMGWLQRFFNILSPF
jgi:flagellar P-ring protein precursor FlgI